MVKKFSCCKPITIATFKRERLVSVVRKHNGPMCWMQTDDVTEEFR